MSFHIDFIKLGLVLLLCFFAYKAQRFIQGAKVGFAFSDLALFRPFSKSTKVALCKAKTALFWISFVFFCLPFANLRYTSYEREGAIFEIPRKGVALFCLLDRSSSMSESIDGMSKLDSAKKILHDWMAQRKNDIIGLMTFARGSQLLCPLTLDREPLFEKLQGVRAAQTPEEDGTELGYAIFKTVNLILGTRHYAERLQREKEPSYAIQNSTIVVLTDGMENPNPLDANHPLRFMRTQEALNFARKAKTKVYFITILGAEDEATFFRLTAPIQEACRATGGDFFVARNSFSLKELYRKIDVLEKSDFPLKKVIYPERDMSSYCIMAGLFLLLLAIWLDTFFLRVLP